MTNCNRQDESCRRRTLTKADVRGFDAAARALDIPASPSLALAVVNFALVVLILALAVPNLAAAVPNLVRVALFLSRAVRDRAPDVRNLAHVVLRLVPSAERLSLFGEHRVLSVVHLVPFAERLALFSISRALISRDMCLPATVGGIRYKTVLEYFSW
jgi:hypothetical protein